MGFLRHLSLALAVTLVPSLAQAASCPKSSKGYDLEVNIELPEPEFVYGSSEDGMDDAVESSQGYVGSPWHRTLGLTSSDFGVYYETSIDTKKVTGGYCVYLRAARVTLGYRDHTIFVSPRYDEGTCELNAIIEHELEHAAINLDTLERYSPKIKTAIGRFLSSRRAVFVYQKSQARSAYIRHFEEQLKPVYRDLGYDLSRQHGSIDSRDGYARVFAQCENW